MWYSFSPTKVRQVSFAINLSIRNSIIAMAADMEEVLIADMQHWRDALRISFIRTVGSKYLLNKKYLPLVVLSMDRLNTLGWILSSTFMVQSRIWTSLSLPPSLAIRPWCLLPAQNQDSWPRERRRPNLTGTHTSIWSRSFLRQQADLVHMPGNSLSTYCEMLTTHQLLSETLGPPSKVFSTVPSPNSNSRQPLRDSWGLLSHPVVLNIWCLWIQYRPTGNAHSLFQSQGRCSFAVWPCCDITSSDDDEHNTDSNFLLLFADVGITPTLLEGLTEVDVLRIARGCRFALDIFTISQQHSLTPVHEPLPHDPELFSF